MQLNVIIKRVREEAIKRYDSRKALTNIDMGHEMITFTTKTLSTRKVNDWGRDEDEDLYIGVDETGWIKYTHTIEYLVGPAKIKNPSVQRLTDEDIYQYLISEECTNNEYLSFMKTAYEFY